ncbi:MAG: hypothetical protein H6727_02360 [Myxococcales bacterium]|nr:hypothetical protein [Myxococcales bacterium]
MRVGRTLFRRVMVWAAILVCVVGWVREARAQDEDAVAKRKRQVLIKQLTCLKKCQDTYHPRLSRCTRTDYGSSCFMYAKLYMTGCLRMCKVSWFCPGFRKTYKQCPENCMKDEIKKIQAKRWDKRRKRWIRMSKSQAKRKMVRVRRGCYGVCKVMGDMCSVDIPQIKSIRMPTLPR